MLGWLHNLKLRASTTRQANKNIIIRPHVACRNSRFFLLALFARYTADIAAMHLRWKNARREKYV